MSSTPWINKYRPGKLKHIVGQDVVIKNLQNWIKSRDLPHVILQGPPGTGKTSAVISLANELFGKYKTERILELNASNDRGINIVRNDIMKFTKFSIDDIENIPNFKLIVLDEADAMTQDAQAALRQIIEDNSQKARFIFMCNYINKIIEPLKSRCAVLKFNNVSGKNFSKRLKKIAKNENMIISKKIIKKIVKLSEGDMRNGIMCLQNLKYLRCEITDREVLEEYGIISNEYLSLIIFIIKEKNIKKIHKLTKDILSYGIDIARLIKQLSFTISKDKLIIEKAKKNMIQYYLDVLIRIREGGDEYIQLFSLLSMSAELIQLKN
jgi:replication factor C subunit 2/4